MKSTLVIFLISCFTVQAQQDSLKLDLGEINNGKYTNAYFNMSFNLPENFYIQTEEDIMELVGHARSELNMESDFSQSVVLFMSKERDYVIPTDFNSTFMLSACARSVNGITLKDEHDYIDYLNDIQLPVLPETAFVSSTVVDEVGGLEFFKTETWIPVGGLSDHIRQVHYVRFFGDVLLDICISFHDNEYNEALVEAFQSIYFATE